MRISVRLVTRLACRVIARVLVPYAKKKALFTSKTFSLLGHCCGSRLNGPDEGGGLFRPIPGKSKEYCSRYHMSTPLGALQQ